MWCECWFTFFREVRATTARKTSKGTSVAVTTYQRRSTWPGLAADIVLFMSSLYEFVFVYKVWMFLSTGYLKGSGPYKWGKQYRLLQYQKSGSKVNSYIQSLF